MTQVNLVNQPNLLPESLDHGKPMKIKLKQIIKSNYQSTQY